MSEKTRTSLQTVAFGYTSAPTTTIFSCVDGAHTALSFATTILASSDRGKNVGWKMVYNFPGKDEKKNRETSTYFCLKHHCRKEVGHFSVQCI